MFIDGPQVRSEDSVSFRVQGDRSGGFPVPSASRPASQVSLAGLAIQRVASGQNLCFVARVTLHQVDVTEAAVTVLMVIPAHKASRPRAGLVEIAKPLSRNSGRYFAVRNRLSTLPFRHSCAGRERGFHALLVQDRLDAVPLRRALDQVRGVMAAVAVVDREAQEDASP